MWPCKRLVMLVPSGFRYGDGSAGTAMPATPSSPAPPPPPPRVEFAPYLPELAARRWSVRRLDVNGRDPLLPLPTLSLLLLALRFFGLSPASAKAGAAGAALVASRFFSASTSRLFVTAAACKGDNRGDGL